MMILSDIKLIHISMHFYSHSQERCPLSNIHLYIYPVSTTDECFCPITTLTIMGCL